SSEPGRNRGGGRQSRLSALAPAALHREWKDGGTHHFPRHRQGVAGASRDRRDITRLPRGGCRREGECFSPPLRQGAIARGQQSPLSARGTRIQLLIAERKNAGLSSSS